MNRTQHRGGGSSPPGQSGAPPGRRSVRETEHRAPGAPGRAVGYDEVRQGELGLPADEAPAPEPALLELPQGGVEAAAVVLDDRVRVRLLLHELEPEATRGGAVARGGVTLAVTGERTGWKRTRRAALAHQKSLAAQRRRPQWLQSSAESTRARRRGSFGNQWSATGAPERDLWVVARYLCRCGGKSAWARR